MTQYLVAVFQDQIKIRFRLYSKAAPQTIAAFFSRLPFSVELVQARWAGEEVWSPKPTKLVIPYENASRNLKKGEIGIAPWIKGNEVKGSIAVVYGNAKLSDKVNAFGIVFPQDRKKLEKTGNKIWQTGKQKVRFSFEK